MTTPTMEPTSSAVTTEAGGSGIAWAVSNNVFYKVVFAWHIEVDELD
jgi:hypothetical protein